MKFLKALGIVAALLLGTACASSQAYREAREEESLSHWDMAVVKYSRALEGDPTNSRYKISLENAKRKASQVHFERGKIYRSSGQPELAVVELEQTRALDPTNHYAENELAKAKDEAAKASAERDGESRMQTAKRRTRGARARAPMLEPASDRPINLNFPTPKPIKQIYQALALAAGINVIFDPQLKDDNVSIVLTNISFQTGLETLMRQENHFYKVIDEKTMLIAADTPANRKTYEDLVIRTFFLSNGDVTEVSNALRSLLQTTRISINKAENSITLRDTADKVAIAEKIVEQNDKQLAEVVIDVELLQINTTKASDIGLLLSQYSVSAGAPAPGGTTDLGVQMTGGTTATSTGPFTWDQLRSLSIRSFGFNIPLVTYNFIKNNTDSELLAKPQLRISEGQKAQLIIGDKVPIPTTTFNTANVVGSSIVPVTSFQYQDVGIKIEVEPRVHHNKEVTLKLVLEVSQLGAAVDFGGQKQPTIGTRTISSNIRLRDGETNFLAGLFRTDKSHGTTTVPFVGEIPLLGRLFTNKTTNTQTTDLVLTLTPHIMRIPDVTEEDMVPVYVGTDSNISFQGTPRIESPTGQGPFDFRREQPPPRSTPAPNALPAPQNLAPSSPPSDPFRSPRESVPPQPTPGPQPPRSEIVPQSAGAVTDSGSQSGLVFDFAPSSIALAVGEQRSMLVRVTGEDGAASTAVTLRYDPAFVQVVAVRSILPDGGVSDSRVEPGRVTLSSPNPVSISGTRAIAEVVLQGRKAGQSKLAFEPGGSSATFNQATVEVR
ncbi:MAG TPA: secretin N-terminal domain-containing protein [Thermoanaerobaculia bacterium]|nr:secretin N-terminal domain-containing protein [Thermoanaerobaculia bacterium]